MFSLCWIPDEGRLIRHQKWLSHHLALKAQLGFDKIVFTDNASDFAYLRQIEHPDLEIKRFPEFIGRTGIHEYPYCWRGLSWVKDHLVANPSVDKIIFLDTDFYVLTPKLADYIKGLNTGWTSFRCKKYGFPEAAMHVLCRDSFNLLKDIPIPSYTHYNGRNMEDILRFTKINEPHLFKGDRYGEGREQQTADMDYYGQWDHTCPTMVFDMKGTA
jgi:hypothetical protein